MNSAIDPWVILPRERVKYLEHFRALNPQNEMITGMQAREFFLQSQLPGAVLGEIWSLADTDSDGKMDINEFSIACKLINLKLRAFEIPKVLPPTLLASLSATGMTPTLTPSGIDSLSPIDPMKTLISKNIMPPARPPIPMQPMSQPIVTHNAALLNQVAAVQPTMTQQPLIPGMGSLAGTIPQNIIPQTQQPLLVGVQSIQPLIPVAGMTYIPPSQPQLIQAAGINNSLIGIDLLSSKIPVAVESTTVLPAPPTPPSGTPSRAMSISDKVPSLDSPGSASGQLEWAIKSQSKLKYTQLFNTTDRQRTGYLTGSQARNLMVLTKLHQTILAQIWALSDMDSDGRLGCEEFVLAMYLCELALQGDAIPTKLPPELIPPSFRKGLSRHGSIVGSSSRHGSVSSQGIPAVDADPSAGLPGQTSFEDKRKENYDKGQAELERRRKVLLDAQRKEQEERERKEREESEKREKARLEAERRQQEELERQLQHQREIEQEKEEKRKREIEQKETARKEMEKQRQLEWEKQRISEMQLQRQREQDKVLKLKAQNQTHNIELSTLNEKIKELSQKICDTRAGVTNVKTVIDGMRQTRDTQMSDMAQLKSRIKEQNAKLVQLSQEKAKLDSKNKLSQQQDVGHQDQAFTNKQILINQLKGKLDTTQQELKVKQTDINTNTEQLTDLKSSLGELINDCEILYSDYDVQRIQIMELKNNRKNESITSAWDTANSWGPPDDTSTTTPATSVTAVSKAGGAGGSYEGYVKYRAIYEFMGRNSDEITFQPGDIIMVPLEQNAEPGWFAGEINGHTGWFPETYVEKVEGESPTTGDYTLNNTIDNNRQLDEIAEVAETTVVPAVENETTELYNGDFEEYIACYPYESNEAGDLVFTVGEHIKVIKKDGDWWTGTIGNRVGIFPSNYVKPVSADDAAQQYIDTSNSQNGNSVIEEQKQMASYKAAETKAANEDADNADSEVSEINTQPQTDHVQETYSRPMSTTSTTPGLRKQKGEVAQVIADYKATSNEQLSLTRGQLIMIRKKTDSGWWEGELQARGRRRQIGWFPATYVKVLQSGRLSGRSTPVSGGKLQMNETILDKVIALYPYKAQNDDELSFEKDDIISVMGRDEPEWWRGECQGLTGLFPSNYVGPFVTSGI